MMLATDRGKLLLAYTLRRQHRLDVIWCRQSCPDPWPCAVFRFASRVWRRGVAGASRPD